MISKIRTLSNQPTKGEVYFRIIPITLKIMNNSFNNFGHWVLYLEKGMQILGRTTSLQKSSPEEQYKFQPNQNKIDFQIASQKNLNNVFNYVWSLYFIDEEGFEERVAAETFSIKEYHSRYDKENVINGYDLTVTSRDNFSVECKLYIQNNAANIKQLVNKIVPQSQQQLSKALAGISKKTSDIVNANKDKNRDKSGLSSVISQNKQQNLPNGKQVSKGFVGLVLGKSEPKQQNKNLFAKNDKNGKSSTPNQNQDKVLSSLESGIKIEQQSQQESFGSESKNKLQSKIQIQGVQNFGLQQIDQDKQKQDLITPLNQQSQFSKKGSLNVALAERVSEENNYQQMINSKPQIEEPVEYPKFETPGEQTEQNKQQKQQDVNTLKSSKLEGKKVETEDINASGNKFKKIIIVVLLLIMVAGIIGSLFSNKVKEDDQEEEQPKKAKKKNQSKKKAKL